MSSTSRSLTGSSTSPHRGLRAVTHVGGWIANNLEAAIDFAGGTAVHINAGAAGLALALILGSGSAGGTIRCGRTTSPS